MNLLVLKNILKLLAMTQILINILTLQPQEQKQQ
jgi:hypothetical protein